MMTVMITMIILVLVMMTLRLHEVARATAVASLMYASPSWWALPRPETENDCSL